jgi:hypothetical protein
VENKRKESFQNNFTEPPPVSRGNMWLRNLAVHPRAANPTILDGGSPNQLMASCSVSLRWVEHVWPYHCIRVLKLLACGCTSAGAE